MNGNMIFAVVIALVSAWFMFCLWSDDIHTGYFNKPAGIILAIVSSFLVAIAMFLLVLWP